VLRWHPPVWKGWLARLHGLALAALAGVWSPAQADEAVWTALKTQPVVMLLRHADAPGMGDPENIVLGRCNTQRNLGEAGRLQAKNIGQTLRERGVPVSKVWASPWCRTLETATLAFGGPVVSQPAFGSFFADRSNEAAFTHQARALLAQWKGPGVLAVFTHQVNITALTGVVPASGEAVVVTAGSVPLRLIGRLPPP
jgi:phosphohistidine phosphatase SixA